MASPTFSFPTTDHADRVPVARHASGERPFRRGLRALLVILLASLIGLTGCSGSKDVAEAPGMPEAFPNHSSRQIHSLITARTDTLSGFKARAQMTVRSPRQSGSFNAEIRQARADSLWMRMSRFGFEGARLLVTQDSFFVHNRLQNQMMVGTVSEAQQYLAAPVTSEDAFVNMLGLIAPNPDVDWSVNSDSSQYYLKSPSGRQTFAIDPTHWRVTRYARTGDDGDVVEERLFGEFERINGVMLPTRVVFRSRPDDALVMLAYKDVRLNPGSLSFDFRVPTDVPRIFLPSSAR